MKKKPVDDLDVEIIKKLQENVRCSYREIASHLGISVGTVHNRIKKLEKRDVIVGFLPKLNPEKFGFKLTFIVQISIKGGEREKVFEQIKERPEIRAIYHVTGENSAVIIANFKSVEDTREFIFDLNQNPAVEKTVSNLVLKRIKEDFDYRLM